jgi:hypothetical protein
MWSMRQSAQPLAVHANVYTPSAIHYIEYMAECPKPTRFERASGIAVVAHMYLAAKIERWAVQEMLDTFQDHEGKISPTLLRQVALSANVQNAKGSNIGRQLLHKVCTEWCSQIPKADDLVAMLLVAKELGDTYFQAHVYYALLKHTNAVLAGDQRLTVIDHVRLMNGVYNLRRYDSMCSQGCLYICSHSSRITYRSQLSGEKGWSPRFLLSPNGKFDGRTLWEMFEYSPTLQKNLSDVFEADRSGLGHGERQS